jgi:hypothetical protein
VKSVWKRFLDWFHWFHMEQSPVRCVAIPDFDDMGVLYSRGTGFLASRSMKCTTGKARRGTYRFDSNGTYHFSKRDAGQEVIISFLERGQPRRQVYTIGM